MFCQCPVSSIPTGGKQARNAAAQGVRIKVLTPSELNSHQKHHLCTPKHLLVTNASWVTAQLPWQGTAAPLNFQRWKHLGHLRSKASVSSW